MPAPIYDHLGPVTKLNVHHPVFITDLSVTVTAEPMTSLVPYNVSPYRDCDPLESDRFRHANTEAQQAGEDKFGASWPMIRAQRIHTGDNEESGIHRKMLSYAKFGQVFTPIEFPYTDVSPPRTSG